MSMKRELEEWTPPATIEEGEEIRVMLVDQLNGIESQLAARKGARDGSGGYAQNSKDYFDWRSRAINAKKFTIARLQKINLWLRQTRRERTASAQRELGFDPTSPDSMLLAAANVFQRLRSDGVEVEHDEIAVFDAIRTYLTTGEVKAVKGEPRT